MKTVERIRTKSEAQQIVGGLSSPSKIPCHCYNLPASQCKVGVRLSTVPGSVCHGCYALKGRYRFRVAQVAMHRRLRSLDDPRWVDAMVFLLQHEPYFRWHDSGDLQSVEHLALIVAVAQAIPGCAFWLPTREYGIVSDYVSRHGSFPSNLIVRLSAHMIDGPLPHRLAEQTGCCVSGVSKNIASANCPAMDQGHQCRDCRLCWDPSKTIIYRLH